MTPAIIVYVTDADGEMQTLEATPGLSVMEVLQQRDLVEGECGGSLACATCHIWVAPDWADHFDAKTEDEDDMLDCAFALKATSRLSCQLLLTNDMDGLQVAIPTL